MHSLFRNQVSIPVHEERLAGNRGVWQREVYPDIWLNHSSGRIKISGIGYDLTPPDRLGEAVEKHLNRENGTLTRLDFRFKRALNVFGREYDLLRGNGMDGLLRAAKRDGVRFVFSETSPDNDLLTSRATAYYCQQRNEIVFLVNPYADFKRSRNQNVLAHELGHYILAEAGRREICCSDFGLKWMSLNQMRRQMLDGKRWGKACKQHYERYGTDHKIISFYGHFIKWELQSMLEHPLYDRAGADQQRQMYQDELMCRILGFTGDRKKGIRCLDTMTADNVLMQIIIRLAETCANGNSVLYHAIRKTVEEYRVAPETVDTMMRFWKTNADLPDRDCSYRELGRLSILFFKFQKALTAEGKNLLHALEEISRDDWVYVFEQKKVRRMIRDYNSRKLQSAYSR